MKNSLPEELLPFFSGDVTKIESAPPEWAGRLRVIPARTVADAGLLPAFRCDEVAVRGAGRTYITRGAVVAVCVNRFTGGAYRGLIGDGFFNEEMKGKGT